MRFLVDAQLPPALAEWLLARGFEAKAVRDVGLREAEDAAIWAFAQAGQWVVVSKDGDFVELVLTSPTGPQVIWLRMGNCANPALMRWLRPLWTDIVRALETGQRVVEVRRTADE